MIVTFLFRIKGDTGRYYGKYIGKCPEEYSEGLDRSLAELLFPFFQAIEPERIMDDTNLSVGVLSAERDVKDYFSEYERDIFDLVYCNWSNQPIEVYWKGSLTKWS
jgi:hypothetical protein